MSNDDSTIENRVYLFKDMASAYLSSNGAQLADPTTRARAIKALSDIAYVACVVADEEEMSADEVAAEIAKRG